MPSATENFMDTVAAYCAWATGGEHRLVAARRLLLELMLPIPELAAGSEIARPEEDDLLAVDVVEVELEEWERMHRAFRDLPFQYYLLTFDPHDLAEDMAVCGDLFDDLADVYRDLSEGLALYRAGQIGVALETLLHGYHAHWGAHAANAVRAIDAYYRRSSLTYPPKQARVEWYGIRTVYHFGVKADGTNLFEERVCAFSGKTFDEAFAKAQREADEYAAGNKMTAHSLQEAYLQDGDPLIDGYEVFSQVFEFSGDLETFYRLRYQAFEYTPDP